MLRAIKNMPAARAFFVVALILFSLTFSASYMRPSVVAAQPAQAGSTSGSVVVTLEGSVVRDGHEVSTDNLQIRPGEVITWKMVVRNRGNRVMHNIQAEGQIPRGTAFVPASVRGDALSVMYSIDGGRSYSERPTIMVDGQERPAPVSSYTNLRITFSGELKPNDVRNASYQTRLR